MKIFMHGSGLKITRDIGDKFMNESTLLYHVKLALNDSGFDLIKKLMWKDGHLVCDYDQYLRVRTSRSKTPRIYISNSSSAIFCAGKRLTEYGRVDLQITYNVWHEQKDCEKMVKNLIGEGIGWQISSKSKNLIH